MSLRAVAVGLAALLITGCLPNPQSVKERRESFDRDGLRGSLIFKERPEGFEQVGAVFGDRIELVGYTLDPATPSPGDLVKVTFYWTAKKPVDEDYQVFVHGDALEGKAGRIHGDHFPAKGKYPTDVWQQGELVADPFRILIPPGYGPKRLGLNTGLYKGNYRVPLTSPGSKPSGKDNRSLAVEMRF